MELDLDSILLFLHVIGATVLLGTGAGIAFFMVAADRTSNAALIAHVASTVVLADFIFTATAVIAQPITGVALALRTGWPLGEGWIFYSILLYILAGVFWLPVVGIQMQMRDLARQAAAENASLPARYHRLYLIWFACGVPAFAAVLAIIWLMLTKPDLGRLFG
jgi:uncharacterized membrane protein